MTEFEEKVKQIKVKKYLDFLYLYGDAGRDDDDKLKKRRYFVRSELLLKLKKKQTSKFSKRNMDYYMSAWALDMTQLRLNDVGITPKNISCVDIEDEYREIQDIAKVRVELDENTKLESIMRLLAIQYYDSVPGLSASCGKGGGIKIKGDGSYEAEFLLFIHFDYEFEKR